MRQPELGKKITELRKNKGYTQEELVEKCNISVRTLQRIEAGEVTPRIYTVKTILAALDFDISTIREEGKGSAMDRIIRFLIPDIDPGLENAYFIKNLKFAWLSGLFYFILGFPEAAIEYFRYKEDDILMGIPAYVILKILILLSFIFMQRGFIILGSIFNNYLLKITSYLIIFGMVVITGYDIASVFYDAIERQFILGAEALAFGGLGIIYGIALVRLSKGLGDAARYAGYFEVITGLFFITVVLSFIGFITTIPAELLEIIVLYKGWEKINDASKRIPEVTE